MVASVVVAKAIRRTSTDVVAVLSETGRSVTEAMGGFWQGVTEDPTFVPLDEYMSDQFIKDLEQGKLDMTDLVLEGGDTHG